MSARSRLGVGAALAVLIIVGSASAASAHAILLRTDPSPQTTVKRAPDVVRLHFSEPVEVAFGAVRVFDVDGHRVDRGQIRLADANREVDVGVRLSDGTYSVTWRVISGDGHSVRGGFGFYVGAPSAISAVAVPAEQGAGRGVSWGFGVVRFAWFGALSALVGLVVVRRWVWTPALRAQGLGDSAMMKAFRRRFGRWMVGAWVVLALAGALSLVFQTASVSGLSLAASARPSPLAEILHTAYGRLWELKMALTALAAVPVAALVRRRLTAGVAPQTWIGVGAAAVAGLCVVSAFDGHARTLGRAALEVPSLALHLGAVAVWVGGLGALMVVGGLAWRGAGAEERAPLVGELIRRFGRVAVGAVAVLVITGAVNAYGDFGALSDFWQVGHGQVVAAKVVLLGIALVLAARHRWTIGRRLGTKAVVEGASAARSFGRSGAVEMGVLLAAVALASALVAMVPGRSLALAANGPVNQEHGAGSYTVQLFIDPTQIGANQVHVSFVNAQGLGAAEVSTTDVRVAPTGAAPQTVDMRIISPGHFVGDAVLAASGPYRLSVTAGAGSQDSTTFTFTLRGTRKK